MRCLRMLEGQKAWKQEAGFDRVDTAAEIDAERFRTLFQNLSTASCAIRDGHTPDEFRLKKGELTSSD